jgi:hypothetical protein
MLASLYERVSHSDSVGVVGSLGIPCAWIKMPFVLCPCSRDHEVCITNARGK